MKFIFAIALIFLYAVSVCAQRQAEVVVSSTYLRQSPDYNSEKIRTMQKGEKVTFEKGREAKGWRYVSILDGTVKGWIRSDTVRAVAETETPKPASNISQEKTTAKPASSRTPTPTATSERQRKIENPLSPKTATVAKTNEPTRTADPTPPAAAPAKVPADAAEVEEDNEVVRVETEEVSVNVRVVDDRNRPVNNLKQADFRVYEDDVLQPVTSVAIAEVPIISALVIDNSRSLRAQLRKVIEAGKIFVGAARPQDEAAVVRFVSSDKIEVLQDFTSNKNALGDALENLYVEGGQTALIDAVYRTAKKAEQYQSSQKKEDVKLRALILVSDGDDRGSTTTERQLFELLRQSSVQIYAVGFVGDLSEEPNSSAAGGGVSRREKARDLLTRLARETGGKVYFPGSIDELPQIAADISGELRTQYLISYSPTNENRDGRFRRIKITVNEGANKEKRIALTRAGRNVPPAQ